jgi:hypothetical protein
VGNGTGVGDVLPAAAGEAVAPALVGLADGVGDCVEVMAGATTLQEMRRNELSATASRI